MAEITFSALYRYRDDLFDLFELPHPPTASEMGVEEAQIAALWTIDKDDFIARLCFETMSFSVAFPDADFLKAMLGAFSRTELPRWQKAFNTLFYKYNPLYNKDAVHTGTTSGSENGNQATQRTYNATDDTTYDGTVSTDGTYYVHGYDDNTVSAPDPTDPERTLGWTHADRVKSTQDTDSTTQFTHNVTEGVQRTDTSTKSGTANWTEKGNIGVMSTQELIQRERDLSLFSIYKMIIDDIVKAFCIMVY